MAPALPRLIALAAGLLSAAPAVEGQAKHPNILMIVVDDLKPEMGCYGSRIAKTPHIDRLAARGTVFLSNYCQQALCGPTRASLLTGMRPDYTRIWDMRVRMRDLNPDILTLPQYLAAQGYTTVGIGKVYDPRCVDADADKPSWTIPYLETDPRYFPTGYRPPAAGRYQSPETRRRIDSVAREAAAKGLPRKEINTLVQDKVKPTTESEEVPDNAYLDGAHALQMRDRLAELAKSDKPFFMAVGLVKPHLPFVSPKRYWDLYDRAQMPVQEFQEKPGGVADYIVGNASEIRSYTDMPAVLAATPQKPFGVTMPVEKQRELLHGYYAAVSYTDANIGLLVDALEALGIRENTIVVLWGDHGWHLGDHNLWCKHTNFEQATRAPLIISAPGLTGNATRAPSEFVDVFPTLCELAGLPVPTHLHGRSQVPVMRNPDARVKEYAVSQYPRNTDPEASRRLGYSNGNQMGYSVRSDRYRYTVWFKDAYRSNRPFDASLITDMELYDYVADPQERVSLASDARYAAAKRKMHEYLLDYLGRQRY